MRDIKFRGKTTEGEWVTGDLVHIKEVVYIMTYDYEEHYDVNDSELWTICDKIIPETVGQFTGLKDKNGVEIYEGDILRCKVKNKDEYHEGEVKFNRSSWVVFQYNEGKIFMRRTSAYREYEIIGNIHEK